MTTFAFLDDAVALEEILAAIYEELARLTDDQRLKTEFQRLQKEEANHALVIRTGKNYVRQAPDTFGKTIVTKTELEGALEAARAILDDVRSGCGNYQEAVAHVRRLENQFEKIHMATAMDIKDETLHKLFQRLSKDDKDHRLTLDEILQKLD